MCITLEVQYDEKVQLNYFSSHLQRKTIIFIWLRAKRDK